MRVHVKEDCTFVVNGQRFYYSAGREYSVPLDVARDMESSGKGELIRAGSKPREVQPFASTAAGPAETKPAQPQEHKEDQQRPSVEQISEMNVEEVLKAVRDGRFRKGDVLEAEKAGNNRKTIISGLEGRKE